ncbi:MAG: histidinol-phosphate transaminase [Candidatus Omnitrophica bacterium]|nr:histidinol-phosphate transaminase [Candidatus Omnitrophota bacterium]
MLFNKELTKIKIYQPGKPIEEVKRSLHLKEVYKLASNEIPFAPTYIKKSILKELKNINRYPQSDCFYLRKIIAKKFNVLPEQIIFGNGSDEIITLCVRAFIKRGDEVIVAYPTFLIYEIQSRISGAKIVRVPLKNFKYDLTGMLDRITKRTKIIFIANPDNPTGTYLNKEEISNFLQNVNGNILVFFDEAYSEFAPKDFPNTIKFLQKKSNIIFTKTFSKIYGLAGLRIGYGISSKEIVSVLNKVREPFNVNRFAQVAAIEVLKNQAFFKKVLSYIQKEKNWLYEQLKNLDINFIESATNFILIKISNAKNCSNYLLKKGIIVRELSGWGLKDFIRVTVGMHKENQLFIEHLKNYLTKFKGG